MRPDLFCKRCQRSNAEHPSILESVYIACRNIDSLPALSSTAPHTSPSCCSGNCMPPTNHVLFAQRTALFLCDYGLSFHNCVPKQEKSQKRQHFSGFCTNTNCYLTRKTQSGGGARAPLV